jgi:hypothetical protein
MGLECGSRDIKIVSPQKIDRLDKMLIATKKVKPQAKVSLLCRVRVLAEPDCLRSLDDQGQIELEPIIDPGDGDRYGGGVCAALAIAKSVSEGIAGLFACCQVFEFPIGIVVEGAIAAVGDQPFRAAGIDAGNGERAAIGVAVVGKHAGGSEGGVFVRGKS